MERVEQIVEANVLADPDRPGLTPPTLYAGDVLKIVPGKDAILHDATTMVQLTRGRALVAVVPVQGEFRHGDWIVTVNDPGRLGLARDGALTVRMRPAPVDMYDRDDQFGTQGVTDDPRREQDETYRQIV